MQLGLVLEEGEHTTDLPGTVAAGGLRRGEHPFLLPIISAPAGDTLSTPGQEDALGMNPRKHLSTQTGLMAWLRKLSPLKLFQF